MTQKSLFVAVLFVCLMLQGCATTSVSRQYRLLPLAETALATESKEAKTTIRLQSVIIPGVLQQPVIVTWNPPAQLVASEFERWAESLEAQIKGVLARNLTVLLSDHRVVRGRSHPGLRTDEDLHVEIVRFDGRLGEKAHLELRWSRSGEGTETHLHVWKGEQEIKGTDTHAYVLAQSELLSQASQVIAQQLR